MTNILSEQPSSDRVGLLVLGMHRAGTSALSRLLNIFGCSLPASLIAANHGNEDGHWESAAIAEFNDQVLNTVGSSWNDCQAVNPDWYNSPIYGGFASQARKLLLSEFDNSPLFVFKDPRNCRLARFWLEAFDAEAIKPAIILPLRHPDEVADSLERRDTMGVGYGQLLWLRHVLDAEQGTRGRPRIFTTYHALLVDWRGVMKRLSEHFSLIWPRNSLVSAAEVDSFLHKREIRSDAPRDIREGADLVSWLSNVYSIIARWSVSGESAADYPLLDRVREEFDRCLRSLGMALLPSQHGGLPGEGERRRIELRDRLAETVAELDRHHSRIVEIEGIAEQLRLQLEASNSDIEVLRSQYGDAEQALLNREADMQHLRDQLKHASDALTEAQYEIQRHSEEEQKLHGELVQQAALFVAARSDNEGLTSQLDERDSVLERLEREQEELRQNNAYLASSLAQRSEELEQSYARVREAERKIEDAADRHLSQQEQFEDTLAQKRRERAFAEQELISAKYELASAKQERDAANRLAADSVARERQYALDREPLEERLADIASVHANLDAQLAIKSSEVAQLSRSLGEEEAAAKGLRENLEWMRRVNVVVNSPPFWWQLLLPKYRWARQQERLKRLNLFDSQKYLNAYPDVARAGLDPLQHYLLHGFVEGRHKF